MAQEKLSKSEFKQILIKSKERLESAEILTPKIFKE